MPTVSIIICTRNRANDLRDTLASLASVRLPVGLDGELVVVDNGSIDETSTVANHCGHLELATRCIREERPGQAHARNAGMAASRGGVILFTDDDIRFPRHWLLGMCAPILRGEADAVAGNSRLAPDLARPWMDRYHRMLLAAMDGAHRDGQPPLTGLNIAFTRRVLERVPAFDPELGPGALGFCDDSFFSLQVQRAGFRILGAPDVIVEHHPDPSRLLRASFVDRVARQARSDAYILHHWHHGSIRRPLVRAVTRAVRLRLWRARHGRDWPYAEGAPRKELQLVYELHLVLGFLAQRRRPRNYERHGLVKRASAT